MMFANPVPRPLRRPPRKRVHAFLATLSVALLLSGCTSGAPNTSDKRPDTAVNATFPRAVTVPAGSTTAATTVEIATSPKRVAALTYETAELVAALGAANRLVMVPNAVTNPVLTHHLDQMQQVETKAPTESTTNAESVIQTAPDLVLLSARHGLEDGAGQVLAAAGIPVLILPNSWATVDDMLANIDLVGQALGRDAEANALAEKVESGVHDAAAEKPATAESAAPRVLVLSNQAGQPFVTAGAAFPLELLSHAGATDAAAELGMTSSGPITAEQVIQADPDAILLVDMNGSGRKIFTPLLKNAAVAALPAVAEDRILLLEGRQVQALGLDGVVGGLDALTTWLITETN